MADELDALHTRRGILQAASTLGMVAALLPLLQPKEDSFAGPALRNRRAIGFSESSIGGHRGRWWIHATHG